MARYYLVSYVHRADGAWVSPPECEEHWLAGCFKQVRFDDASGVGLVKCLGDQPLPCGTEIVDERAEIRAWLASIPRAQKSGPTPKNPTAPVILMTLDEEVAVCRKIGGGFGDEPYASHREKCGPLMEQPRVTLPTRTGAPPRSPMTRDQMLALIDATR